MSTDKTQAHTDWALVLPEQMQLLASISDSFPTDAAYLCIGADGAVWIAGHHMLEMNNAFYSVSREREVKIVNADTGEPVTDG